MRFEKLLGSKQEEFVGTFRPVHPAIVIPKQYDLWDNPPNGSHVTMGYFYELFIHCLFGGTVTNHIFIKKENDDGLGLSKPDIVTRTRIIESKACVIGNQAILHDGQMMRYNQLQLANEKKQIHFAFCRHRFRNIMSYKGSQLELFEALSKKTICIIIVPLKIVNALHNCINETMVRRYEEKPTYGACTVIRSPILNMLALDPVEIIKGLELDQDEFIIKKCMAPKLSIDNTVIEKKPLVIITDKKFQDYAQKLSLTYDEDIPF